MPRPRAHTMQPPWPRQRGAAFMVMLVIMIIGAITIFVSALNSSALYISRDKATADALARAKEALTGYSVATATSPGGLPCPDLLTNVPGSNVPNDGIADIPVGGVCPSYIGRLPWKTLGLPDLRDGSGERLWYALSPNFPDGSSAPINSNSLGTLQVYDNSGVTLLTSPTSPAAAIIFAPGSIVESQQRDAANQNNAQNYLDAGPNGKNNYTAAGPFVAADMSSTFNDRLLVIRASDILPLVEARVGGELATSFAKYLAAQPTPPRYYPHPANFNTCTSASCLSDNTQCIGKVPVTDMAAYLPLWFTPNNWFDVVYYSAGTNALAGGSGTGGGHSGNGKAGHGNNGLGSVNGSTGSSGNGTSCAVTSPNLTVSGTGVNALFILPGTPLGSITRASSLNSTNLTDYFENAENTNLDSIYVIPSNTAPNSNDSLFALP